MVQPSRLVLGGKFFWILFIYAVERIVVALQFFVDKVSPLEHPIAHTYIHVIRLNYEWNDDKLDWTGFAF